jgi:Tfp pilus assembly protein PilF
VAPDSRGLAIPKQVEALRKTPKITVLPECILWLGLQPFNVGGPVGAGDLADFCEQLRDLRRRAGMPTFKQLRVRMELAPAAATLSALLSGKISRVPRWELVSELVRACITHAAVIGIPLDGPEADLRTWRRRHEELHRVMDSGSSAPSSDVLTLLAPLLRTGSEVPRLGELSDEDLGVPATSKRTHRYIPRRDFDDEFAAAMADAAAPYPYLMVYGDLRAGKTSSAIAGVRAALPAQTVVLVPKNGQALAGLVRLEALPKFTDSPALIWLDDVAAVDLEALSVTMLDQLTTWAAVVGTITAERCAQILDTASGEGSRARAVLRRAYHVYLPMELTDEENAAAARLYPERRFHGRIANAFIGIDELRLRLNTARHANPAGAAIVRAAIDCSRAGVDRPLTSAELRRLSNLYLSESGTPTPTDEAFDSGLAWAQEPIGDNLALLSRVPAADGEPQWQAYAELARTERSQILSSFWPELIDLLDPNECKRVGLFAAVQLNLPVYASAAFAKAAEAEDSDGERTLLLGAVLPDLGDLANAERAFRSVMASGTPENASAAALCLGSMLAKADQSDKAIEVYTAGAGFDDPQYSPFALWALGTELCKAERFAEAIAPLKKAAASGHSEAAPAALGMLAAITSDQGDLDGALHLWQQLLDVADDSISSLVKSQIQELVTKKSELEQIRGIEISKLTLAERLVRLGDREGAIRAYLEAQAEDSELTATVQLKVGELHRAQGRIEEAILAYEASIAVGNTQESGTAALNLGALHIEYANDRHAARRAFECALNCDGTEMQAMAATNLGLLAEQDGDTGTAVTYFEMAQIFEIPHLKAKAALNIAAILEGCDANSQEVDRHYRVAIDAGDPELSFQAAAALAGRLLDRDEIDEALELLDLALNSNDQESRGKAAWLLGKYRERRGDLAGAIEAYEWAISSNNEEFSIAGHSSLGLLLAEQNGYQEAEEHLLLAYESRNPKWAREAGLALGVMYWASDRYQKADPVLTWVFNSNEIHEASFAGFFLGQIYLKTGRHEQAQAILRFVVELEHQPAARLAEELLNRHF